MKCTVWISGIAARGTKPPLKGSDAMAFVRIVAEVGIELCDGIKVWNAGLREAGREARR